MFHLEGIDGAKESPDLERSELAQSGHGEPSSNVFMADHNRRFP
jgi:hypothetical protein